MKLITYFLTQELTKRIVDKIAEDGAQQVESCRVYPTTVYRWIFWIGLAMGAAFFLVLTFFHLVGWGVFMLLFFGIPSIIGLFTLYNDLLVYDEKGFTWRNAVRITRRYSYEDVTGIYVSPNRVVVQLKGGKRLDFDEGFVNRRGFAKAVGKYRSRKPSKILDPVIGMTSREIGESYENGTLAQALLVKEEEFPGFLRHKRIHRWICSLSAVLSAGALLLCSELKESDPLIRFILQGVPSMLLMGGAIYLYFRYPQYYTAREIPVNQELPKQMLVRHKRCTMSYCSLFGIIGGGVFFVLQFAEGRSYSMLWLAAVVTGILFIAMELLFRRYSWEYRNFRVGYASYTVWQVLFCSSVFFVFGGLLLI